MKRTVSYTEQIEIEGKEYTILLVKREHETGTMFDSYLINFDTGNAILLDNMAVNHPYLKPNAPLTINEIMNLAIKQAFDIYTDLQRTDKFSEILNDLTDEMYYRYHANHLKN